MSLFSLLSAILILHRMSLVACWMDAPYDNNEFNVRIQYGHNATLECSDNRIPDGSTFQYWVRPDLTVMAQGDNFEYWTLYGYASWTVSDNGMELYATNVNERQFGFYYCVVESAGETYVVKKAINYMGPHFGKLWPKYRMNVIIGLSAAGIFVVLIILFSIFVSCTKKDTEKETKREPLDVVSTDREGNSTQAPSGEHYGLKRRDVVSVDGYDSFVGDNYNEIRL